MKKILILLVLPFLLVACSIGEDMSNTPTRKVETFFLKYQSLDEDVLDDLDDIIKEDESFNNEQREKYREIFKRHYEDLKYDIKDEKIDGDSATVEVEIEVYDYSRALARAEAYMNDNHDEFLGEDGTYDNSKFIDYQLNELANVDETIIYNLSLSLRKENDEWVMNQLTSVQEEKINGIYVY